METPEYTYPQRNIFEFDYVTDDDRNLKLRFNSHFDSGNMLSVDPQPNNLFLVTTAPDCYSTEFQGHTRSWFYFSVTGAPRGVKLTFKIPYIHMLFSLYKKAPDTYRPVYKIDEGPWKRLPESASLVHNEEQNSLEVTFSYIFEHQDDEVYFAFSYPFSYSESQRMLESLETEYKDDPEIYFHRDKIALSPQQRIIDLLTISSHDGKMICPESWISDELFPYRDKESRAIKYKPSKPVILITARVHPGETPGSHSMNGILKFMLDKNDVRAFLLRRYFVLMVVPMINPDGVSLGHYRMDIYHHNLNRHYKEPDPKKQPQIFAIKELVTYLKSEERLFFFCDLHSHAEKKGCFLFGNALDYPMHVESVLFAKVMSLNSINFEFDSCDFSKRQMNTRDRGEKLTKEGAARVCVYKIANILHSYTLECGFHYSCELSNIPNISNNINIGDFNCNENNVTDINSDIYANNKPVYYTIEIYEDIGKAMMISILDIFQRNPCSRIVNSPYQSLEQVRKEIAFKVMKYARFKKDVFIRKKYLKIEDIAKEIFYDNFTNKNVFFDDNKKKGIYEPPFTRRLMTTDKKIPLEKAKTPGVSLSIPNMTLSNNKFLGKNSMESPKFPARKVLPTKMQTIGTKESLNIDLKNVEQDENRMEILDEQTFMRFGNKFPGVNKNTKALAPLPHDYITRQRMVNQKLKLAQIYSENPRETPKRKPGSNPFDDAYENANRDLEEEKNLENAYNRTKYNSGSLQPINPYKKYAYKSRNDKFNQSRVSFTQKLPDIKGFGQPNMTGSAYFLVVEAKNLVTAKGGQKKNLDFGSKNFELNDSLIKN